MHDCLINGEISHSVNPSDRGLNYGDGLFETIRVTAGKPRFWQGHMDRLETGCQRLGIERPNQAVLLREVQTVIAGNPECVVKIVVTRGVPGPSAVRGYAPPKNCSVTRIVSAHLLPSDFHTTIEGIGDPNDQSHSRAGLRLRICSLRLANQPVLAGIKHLNRLEQVMARAEWNDPEISEGVLLDENDHLVCGTASNIFLVSAGRMLTPRLDRCGVRGVMRSEILKLFSARCEQRRITLDMVPEADEVFLCNSVRGIMPVHRIDDWRYNLGPVTAEVREWLERL
ncbi:MAG TPA: aminodeoxychorismate lyase [Xanthomonadales bacterium]|nr:aminodeoxychorismate lyase [Xanthomonadales bacterium]